MVSSSTVLLSSRWNCEKQRILAILGSTTQPNFFFIIFTSSSSSLILALAQLFTVGHHRLCRLRSSFDVNNSFDRFSEAGVTRADGKQQGSRKRLISLVDDSDDSDVEISQPTQKTKPRRQTSFGTATGKPMLQSTIDGGVGSSARQ
ncbi:hypothetical protein Bca52824_043521 [Brassica carinata]|uniref:Uncharacterized protein n=1 Tax=Brassica carinata TaxID=52824 RepID=A0A8X7UZS6_BRACI|nr:hypothetical protein Bca52824_043521 [Brassica carinata]